MLKMLLTFQVGLRDLGLEVYHGEQELNLVLVSHFGYSR